MMRSLTIIFIWGDPHMLTVSKTLYAHIEGCKEEPVPPYFGWRHLEQLIPACM